ncbi:hypothetical protein B0H14DRAFT_2740787, partial [Mycena olivaceomarginata]
FKRAARKPQARLKPTVFAASCLLHFLLPFSLFCYLQFPRCFPTPPGNFRSHPKWRRCLSKQIWTRPPSEKITWTSWVYFTWKPAFVIRTVPSTCLPFS